MSRILHPATGFPVGDPAACPIDLQSPPAPPALETALASLILSASGWRKLFAADGREDSLAADVSQADLLLTACMAAVFAERLLERKGTASSPAVALGIDTRLTGPVLADVMIRVFLASGVQPRYAFILPAPEIMAWAREPGSGLDGFCYISASHNPPGYNGVKFGYADGGVLPGSEAGALADRLRALVGDPEAGRRIAGLAARAGERELSRIFTACPAEKRRAISAYTLFARAVAADREDLEAQEAILDEVAAGAADHPLGVVAEMNGSARSLSIDEDFLSMLGVRSRLVNAKPRAFAHRIVPEGASLDLCRAELASARAQDSSFLLGYVPDCDGDRGNLVRWDGRAGRAVSLEAQEVFSLAVLAELSALAGSGGPSRQGSAAAPWLALAVNDATSLRVDAIARAFGVEVYRSETGEANVVNLARSLRTRGYTVRILGEGSNGGNITHPAAVRDPLNTVAALVKLWVLRGEGRETGLFYAWMKASGRSAEYFPDFTLDDVVESLPAWTTTSVFEERALMRIPELDAVDLKRRYHREFLKAWEGRSEELRTRFGFVSWEAWASRGPGETRASEDFGAAEKGGLKILFRDASDLPSGFLWMRGSGTEPVLRIMADLRGRNPEGEAYLLDWQRSMVEAAVRSLDAV